jgi:glutathione S-transferase
MPEYELYCFAQSGNAYRAALMLNLIGADWKPVFVDFFKGQSRTPEYRTQINEMGEAPVLAHGGRKLTQSGVILTYLARRSRQIPAQGEDEELEALRWIIFDNQKVNGFLGPYRFLKTLPSRRRSRRARLLQGTHRRQSRHRQQAAGGPQFLLGDRPTIADVSLAGYSIIRRGVRLRHRQGASWRSALGASASRRCPAGRIRTI